MRSHGREPRQVFCDELFKFGAGPVVTSHRSWLYPVGFKKKERLIQIAEVPGWCPGLISSDDMGELAIGFQFDKKVMTASGEESP
eukprot:4140977-Heterocapsa_arctica.AAC.1